MAAMRAPASRPVRVRVAPRPPETAVGETLPRTTVRNANEADEQQLLELLPRAFDRWPQFELDVPAVEHLRWKMRSDPIAGRQHWVTEVDGRIVAMLLRIVRRVRVRGRDYMNWRYCDPAAGRFTVRAAEQEGRILGYLVFKLSRGEARIADLLALPERTDVVRSLIEDALFREAGAELASCWMITWHPCNHILRRYGFFDSGKDIGFLFRPVDPDRGFLDFMVDPDTRIHLTHGGSDWI